MIYTFILRDHKKKWSWRHEYPSLPFNGIKTSLLNLDAELIVDNVVIKSWKAYSCDVTVVHNETEEIIVAMIRKRKLEAV
jgi:hypothetical protein